jgi:hypothetical protein
MLGGQRPREVYSWAAVAALGDAAVFASAVSRGRLGGAPLALALPLIAAILFCGTIGLVWRGNTMARTSAPPPDGRSR